MKPDAKTDSPPNNKHSAESERDEGFIRAVEEKRRRMIRGRQRRRESLWYGLGMFGVVGWLVMIPTIIGIAVGVWLDARFSDRVSWTLMLSVLGIIIGCLNAWFWIVRQQQDIEDERRDD